MASVIVHGPHWGFELLTSTGYADVDGTHDAGYVATEDPATGRWTVGVTAIGLAAHGDPGESRGVVEAALGEALCELFCLVALAKRDASEDFTALEYEQAKTLLQCALYVGRTGRGAAGHASGDGPSSFNLGLLRNMAEALPTGPGGVFSGKRIGDPVVLRDRFR